MINFLVVCEQSLAHCGTDQQKQKEIKGQAGSGSGQNPKQLS